MRGTDGALDPGLHHFLETDAQAPPVLGLRVHTASGAALCLLMAFGDSAGIETSLYNVTACHQEGKEAVHPLRALIDDGVRGGPVELGPYFVEVGREAVSVFMNCSSVHAGEALAFAGSHANGKGVVVTHRFPSVSSYTVSFASRTQAGLGPAWRSVAVCYRMQPLSVYTNGTVFATDADIAFEAVTTETIPLEFMWYFGDDPPVRTTSRSVRRRLRVPRGYQVTVKASSMVSSVVSKPHLVRVQQRIVANRLLSAASALVNTSVAFECRISFGTDVAYRWDFGDGTVSLGSHRSSHVYSREGEFTVQVLAFNAVSTATLQKRLFIVRESCQPPPVKNMGPGKVQIWRSQPLRLGVTFEAAVLCDISQGLAYTWSFLDAKGSRVPLPAAVNTRRQTVVLPGYTLASGNYTATAKVQIRGSVVHSDYCVGVEVRPRAPVSVIAEGTHLFVPRNAPAPIVLRGSQSYDPDHPGATLRYYWTCSAASSPGQPCFEDSLPSLMDTGSPTIAFSARWLSTCCDQFLMTLTVSSGGRNSSEAQVFLSTRQDPTFRFVRISWASFRGASVNWNAELSLRAACEGCGDVPGLSFSWELFLVNATEDGPVAAPSCRAVGLLGVSGLGAVWKSSEPIPLSTEPSTPDPEGAPMLFPREPSPETLGQPAVSAPGSASPESTAGPRRVPAAGDTVVPGEDPEEGLLGPELASWDEEAPTGSPSESGWSPPHPDFEAYYSDIQEAEPSRGRQPGGNTSPPESGASEDDEGSPSEGDNLVGPFLSAGRAQPALLIDWPKTPVSRAVFQSYTSSGITGPVVTIKPFSLSSGRTYVLQASVVSTHGLLGKAQLYLVMNRAPQDVACQVQPHWGLEAHTLFSIFCMSGKRDLEYEFSYQIGNAPRRTLYHGRDAQYYFVLPAGEPSDGYKVTVSTEITDGLGSKAQPCAVAVTVLPRYRGMHCPTEDLYNSSLRNLSTLQLMGSYTEIRNYVTMLTGILNRLTTEDGSASCGQWSLIRDALISSVCSFAFADEEEVMGVVPTLKDLVSFPPKVSSASTLLLLRFARALLAQGHLHRGLVLGLGLRLELIRLLSRVWEGSRQEEALARTPVWEDSLEVVSALLLGCLSLHHERELRVSAGPVEFLALLHNGPQQSVQSLGPVQVHLPDDLAGHSRAGEETQSPCYISQLVLFRKNPHPRAGRAAGQVGGAVGLTLHTCSGTRPIRRHRLASPVTVEFGEDDGPGSRRSKTAFTLLRDRVNLHPFAGLSEDAQESLQIHIEFSTPASRAFPVLLLVRFSERPTPSSFLVKQTFLWEGQTVQIYTPAAAWKASRVGYLSLLDADYNRRSPNKYLAELVNYTVRFQWLQCLMWDKGEWKSGSFSPQPGTSPEKVSCSYDRLALFSVLRRELNTSLEVSHVSELRSRPRNLIPSACVVVFTVLYGLLAAKSRGVDHREKEKTGSIFLQEEVPPGHQLYAVVVDTGFRAPARFSSKVYIVLCGENGLSETRELHCPRRPLFERNSRHTFVLSAPAQLGALRMIRLWHDGRGPSPSWFVSHVMVKELRSGRAWFFPAQCWLAASRRGGCVDRELACLRRGPGFWKLFHAKSTEYLEDFHVWLSVYSRPSGSGFLHTPRLAVSFCLLCVYACLAALVTTGAHSQLFPAAGPTDLTLRTSQLGLLCSLLGSPAAQLLSLLFRLSEEATRPPQAGPGSPQRGVQARAPQGPNSCRKTLDAPEPDQTAPNPWGCWVPPSELTAAELGHVPTHATPSPLQAAGGTIVEGAAVRGDTDLGLTLSFQHPASAALSGHHQAWRKAASSQSTACPHQGSGTWGASRSEPVLGEKSHCCPARPPAPGHGPGELLLPRPRALLLWSGRAAWAVCGTTSLACALGTAFLSYRFEPAQCVWWLHLLLLSVVCCVFITQPLMICVVALGFAWKRRDDSHFFAESLNEATRDLDVGLEGRSRTHGCPCSPGCVGAVAEVLAARQRARRLRWARPPAPAQLKVTRGRMKRERRTRAALRDVSVHALRLLLLLCLTSGRFSPEESSLNQALRKQFTSSAAHSWDGPRSPEGWWDWSLTVLLDGLHPAGPSPGAQPGPLGGRCHLLGSPVIKQLKVAPQGSCKLASLFWANSQIPTSARLPWLQSRGFPAGPWVGQSPLCMAWRTRPFRLAAPSGDSSLLFCGSRLPTGQVCAETSVSPESPCHGKPAQSHHLPAEPEPEAVSQAAEGPVVQGGRGSGAPEFRSVGSRDVSPDWWLVLQPPGPSSATVEDSPRSQSPEAEGPENRNRSPSCPGGCGVSADCVHSLGRTRREVQAALTGLRASRWIGRSTRAVSVHFTLFHPPSRLFTSVALGVEILPTGALVPSSQVDSVSVFRSDSALDHGLVLSELASLVLSLAHLCFQVYAMVDEDGLSYWHKPGNWLELAVAGTGFTYHVAAGHLATLAGEVADQFHRGFYQVFVDLSPMVSWNQRVRWLQGFLSFLLLWRCVELLGPLALPAACSPVLCRSLSRALVPALAGALLLAAHCHLHRLLLATWAPAAFPGLPLGFPRRSQTDSRFSLLQADPRAAACYRMALGAVLATLCFRTLRRALRTSSRKRRSFPSRSRVRLGDVRAYARRKVLAVLGLGTPQSEEMEVAEDHNHYLDELASLMDELLTKVNGLSDSPHLPLLEKQPRSPAAARAEGSPLPGGSQSPGDQDERMTPSQEPSLAASLLQPSSPTLVPRTTAAHPELLGLLPAQTPAFSPGPAPPAPTSCCTTTQREDPWGRAPKSQPLCHRGRRQVPGQWS
ncbi:polycystin-1-like protein 1 [Oryctolagus cuniculus]|uniref:polycystin-1-like protein 1 n=1 Tax=Oryctolagus cuniculus TaxID=9986 RepID=UPI0038798670